MNTVEIKRLETIRQLEFERYEQLKVLLLKEKQDNARLRLDNFILQSKLIKANQFIADLLKQSNC